MKQRLNKDGIKYLSTPFRWTILMAVSFFLAADRLNISRAWLDFGIHISGAIAGGLLIWQFAPGLANQRASVKKGTQRWDKVILTLYFLLVLLVTPIVAGLDVGRYQWSHLGVGYAIIGIALYLAFFLLFYWAMMLQNELEGYTAYAQKIKYRLIPGIW